MKNTYLIIILALTLGACKSETKKDSTKDKVSNVESQEVNVYTHRHYEVDQMLFAEF